MRHCCVIGGTGFIGSYVVHQLSMTDRRVTVIGRSALPRGYIPKNVRYCAGDYGDKAFLTNVISDADEIINLAYSSVPKTSFDDPVFDIQSNLPSAVALFQVAAQLNINKIVLVSSGGTVYGNAKTASIDETHLTNPVSPYGITKLAIEKYGLMFNAINDLPLVIARPGNAYGSGQIPFSGQGFIATAIGSVLQGKPITLFGKTGTIRDYIHVTDVARGIVALLTDGDVGQCYNIGSNVGRSNLDIIDALRPLAGQIGMDLQVQVLPERKFDVSTNVLNSRKLTSDTGWTEKMSFCEGLSETWNAFLKTLHA